MLSLTQPRVYRQSSLGNCYFFGELGLNGTIRLNSGLLLKIGAIKNNLAEGVVFISRGNLDEASLLADVVDIRPVDNLKQLYRHLLGEVRLQRLEHHQPSSNSTAEV